MARFKQKVSWVVGVLSLLVLSAGVEATAVEKVWNFDGDTIDSLPRGLVVGTLFDGRPAGDWKVLRTDQAKSPSQVLGQVQGKGAEHAYKVVLVAGTDGSDADLEVSFFPVDGKADMDSGIRVPLLVFDIRPIIDHALDDDGLEAVNGAGIDDGEPAQDDGKSQRRAGHPCGAVAWHHSRPGEEARGDGRHRREHQNRGGRIQYLQQPEREEAPQRRADEIRGVDFADRELAARQRQGDHHAGEEERDRQDQRQFRPQNNRCRRDDHRQREGQLNQEAGTDAEAISGGKQRQIGRQCLAGQSAGAVDPDGTGGHPEHGHADRKKGQVIKRGHRQQPRLEDLQRRDGCANKEDTSVKKRSLHTAAAVSRSKGAVPIPQQPHFSEFG